MLNYDKLAKIVEEYKNEFPSRWSAESYKWKAVKHFQENWDINAPDFLEMFSKATEKTENLLHTGMFWPRDMMIRYIKDNSDVVRDMFKELFDESKPLSERIIDFTSNVKTLNVINDPSKKHQQTAKAISTYLWLRYPEKYYIYKYDEYSKIAHLVNYPIISKKSSEAEKIQDTINLYNELSTFLARDNSMKQIALQLITSDCYEDKNMKIWAGDLGYYINQKTTESKDYLQSQTTDNDVEKLESMTLRKDSKMQQMRNIPLNQILYGPPGTGKTYNTVVECIHILDNELYNQYLISTDQIGFYKDSLLPKYNQFKKQGRIEFITFHQSYSYEEFVEGIKPEVSGDTKEVEYNVKPGIFKTICEKASTPAVLQNKWNINSDAAIWKVSLSRTYDNPIRKDCFENDRIRIGWDDYGENYEDKATEGKRSLDAFYQKMKKGDIVLSCYTNRIIDGIGIVEGDPIFDSSLSEYKRTRKVNWIVKNIKEDIVEINDNKTMTLSAVYNIGIPLEKVIAILHKYNTQAPITKENDQKFVLVIDEINRGNISKIFGELITLIEDDKRSQLTVRLPYSQKPFTVPKNLYIIGTMNTADRSIAAIDIALRRRFTFIPKMPEVKRVPNEFSMKEAFENLNKKIRILLDEDHQIGHSYFMNVKSIQDLRETWANKIIPLLNEYFYGDWTKLKLLIPGFIVTDKINNKELEDEIGENCYYRFNDPFSLSDDDFIKATLGLKLETTAA